MESSLDRVAEMVNLHRESSGKSALPHVLPIRVVDVGDFVASVRKVSSEGSRGRVSGIELLLGSGQIETLQYYLWKSEGPYVKQKDQ